jgi:IclR helix-turn-helix domain
MERSPIQTIVCIGRPRPAFSPAVYLDQSPPISITLSPAQVDDVLRAAAQSRAPSVSTLVGAAETRSDREPPSGMLPADTSDRRLSRSLLRGLSILTRFNADGEPRGIIELARELDMSPSTAHRYALTLVELGLLERCPRTRKYSLPGAAIGR